MRVVRLVSGSDCQSSQLSVEAVKLINAIDTDRARSKDVAKLCCQAGLCPVIFINKNTKVR
ncbi:hypothetical protein AZI87_10715 [Bdellovibrio bacteriovorus]|uniref:Uncharacterized protein n=1 Tax=Bdellovibrio bacteriovorus TaxID=959 RepID=A0A162G5R2_BDEBC|nr:hypothetical protein AZI87_10715 [Bdellovibrio bacteriovorus]